MIEEKLTWQAPENVALVIVDVQNDFCTGGKLAVPAGEEVVPVINSLREHFQIVVLTQDFHPEGHKSFASSHGRGEMEYVWIKGGEIVGEVAVSDDGVPQDKPEDAPVEGALPQTMWPDHCVQGTEGAEFRGDLVTKSTDLHITKGTDIKMDSYSGFYENDRKTPPTFDDENNSTLTENLKSKDVDTVVFVGLATDFCVGYHALDAIKDGFNAVVVLDATRGIGIPTGENSTTVTDMISRMEKAGVQIVNSPNLKPALAA